MRHRLAWLLGGWVVGTFSAAWLRRRVRQGVRRYAPEHLRREALDRSAALADGLRRITREVAAATRFGTDEARTTRRSLGHEFSTRRHRRPIRDRG